MFKIAIFHLFSFFIFVSASPSKFFECEKIIKEIASDDQAKHIIRSAHHEKFKFSSKCLEMILKKNFLDTGDFLLNEYYPKTNIDTEIIVRKIL